MRNPLADFYRCADSFVELTPPEELHPQPGYFTFGAGVTCYGRSVLSSPRMLNGRALPDLSNHVDHDPSAPRLPFDASTIVDNLRLERYPMKAHSGVSGLLA